MAAGVEGDGRDRRVAHPGLVLVGDGVRRGDEGAEARVLRVLEDDERPVERRAEPRVLEGGALAAAAVLEPADVRLRRPREPGAPGPGPRRVRRGERRSQVGAHGEVEVQPAALAGPHGHPLLKGQVDVRGAQLGVAGEGAVVLEAGERARGRIGGRPARVVPNLVAARRLERAQHHEELPGGGHVGEERVAPAVEPGMDELVRVGAAGVVEVDLIEDVEVDVLPRRVRQLVADDQQRLPRHRRIAPRDQEPRARGRPGAGVVARGERARRGVVALEPGLGVQAPAARVLEARALVAEEAGVIDDLVHRRDPRGASQVVQLAEARRARRGVPRGELAGHPHGHQVSPVGEVQSRSRGRGGFGDRHVAAST